MADGEMKLLLESRRLMNGSVEDVLKQCLPDILECPVCFESMEPPISLCKNGHNICPRCRPRLNNCPTCRQSILLTRNVALEKLAERCLEKCQNCDVGCEVKKASIHDIFSHMKVCAYRQVQSTLPARSRMPQNNGGLFREVHEVIFNIILFHDFCNVCLLDTKYFLISCFLSLLIKVLVFLVFAGAT